MVMNPPRLPMSGGNNPDPSRSPSSFRRNVLSYLTTLSHVSAPFLTTFVLIHLTAPAIANLGGSSLASQTMLLGREYYQTSFGEKYLLLAPLAVHSVSGIAKRLCSPKKAPPRRLSSWLSLTAYSAFVVFLPIHFFTHRLAPMTPEPPISAVGPSELDYEFVKVGLHRWPLTSWFLYAGLVGSVAVHMVDGMTILYNKYLRRAARAPKPLSVGRRQRIPWASLTIILPVLSGLYFIAKEPPMLFNSVARRFEAVFLRSSVYLP